MRKNIVTNILVIAAASFAVCINAASYQVIDLGNLGGDNSFASGINISGDVIGTANGPLISEDGTLREFNFHATRYISSGNEDLGAFGANNSFAFRINDAGVVVGNVVDTIEREVIATDGTVSTITSTEEFAATFPGGAPQKLIFDIDIRQTRAVDINQAGQIVGYGQLDVDTSNDDLNFANRGFVANTDGTFEYLPIFGDDQTTIFASFVTAINEQGVVVGFAQETNEEFSLVGQAGYVYHFNADDSILRIPDRGGIFTAITDINDNNIVVGRSQDRNGFFAAYTYSLDDAEDSLTDIPYFNSSFQDATANAVNNSNQVVGNVLVTPLQPASNRKYGGFIFQNNELSLLNNLIACDSGWDLQQANDINENGEIVGTGTFGGEVRAYKLVPTGGQPEVCETDGGSNSGGSWSLFGLTLLGLFGWMRRRS